MITHVKGDKSENESLCYHSEKHAKNGTCT
jgi:hypothetical protein